MRRTRRTSRRYRGSSGGGIGIIIPVLIVLCIIAAGVLYFVNENIAFTKDGTLFETWGSKEKDEIVDANLVIENSEKENPLDADVSSSEAEAPSEPSVSTPQSGVRARFISIGSVKSAELFDAALSELSPDAGWNTVVLEVKAEDGTLAFASSSPLATNAAVSGDDALLSSAISKAKEKGLRVALYMSCFKDNEAARKNQAFSVRTSNKIIWLDGQNTRWLSAYSDSAQQYIISCIETLKAFSPDEIILSNVSFPAIGKTEILAYETSLGTKRDMIKSFIEDAKEAAGDIKLSAVYENYTAALASQSGQTAEDFSVFDSIYAYHNATKYADGFAAAEKAFDGMDVSLIPITSDSSADEFIMK